MNYSDAIATVNAVGTLLVGVATAAIAGAAYAHQRRQARLEEEREVRRCLDEFRASYEAWVASEYPRDQKAGVVDSGRRIISMLDSGRVEVGELERRLLLMDGHAFWVTDRPSHAAWGVRDLKESDAQWVEGIINGVLDVVKDSVVEESDLGHLNDRFFLELEIPSLYDEEGRVVTDASEASLDEAAVRAALSRWVRTGPLPEDVLDRLASLMRYKLKMENALWFVKANHIVGWEQAPDARKFADVCCPMVMTGLVQEFEDEARKRLQQLRGRR